MVVSNRRTVLYFTVFLPKVGKIQGEEIVTEMPQMFQLKHFYLIPSKATLLGLCPFWNSHSRSQLKSPGPTSSHSSEKLYLIKDHPTSKSEAEALLLLNKYFVIESVRKHLHELAKSTLP